MSKSRINYAMQFRVFLVRGVALGIGFTAIALGVLYAQSLTSFSPGQVVSAAAINSNFAQLNARVAPVGGIIAWHKSMSGTPALPAGWVECDGGMISDPDSPFDGQNAPNLNHPYQSWNSRGVFLRGHIASGLFETDQFQGHGHSISPNPHGHQISRRIANDAWPGGAGVGQSSGSFTDVSPDPRLQALGTVLTVGNALNSGFGAIRQGTETRSTNMSVVWIMRVK